MRIKINGKLVEVGDDSEMPLLWALRDIAGLKGTKYGCGVAVCGACTVHIDGVAAYACRVMLGEIAGEVVTIEGVGTIKNPHPVQKAWIEEQVPQCGYCQTGQIMNAIAFLRQNPDPSDEEIDEAMSGNLCRCGTYPRIRAAIRRAANREEG